MEQYNLVQVSEKQLEHCDSCQMATPYCWETTSCQFTSTMFYFNCSWKCISISTVTNQYEGVTGAYHTQTALPRIEAIPGLISNRQDQEMGHEDHHKQGKVSPGFLVLCIDSSKYVQSAFTVVKSMDIGAVAHIQNFPFLLTFAFILWFPSGLHCSHLGQNVSVMHYVSFHLGWDGFHRDKSVLIR